MIDDVGLDAFICSGAIPITIHALSARIGVTHVVANGLVLIAVRDIPFHTP